MTRRRKSPIWLISAEDLIISVMANTTYSGVLQDLGLTPEGRHWNTLKNRLKDLEVSTDHFIKTSSKPRTEPIAPELVLIENSPFRSPTAKRIYKRFKGVPYECVECGQGHEWRGKPLTLVFDHKDGDNRNHTPSNLRWLCPNCNSQTETFCGRNISNPKRRKAEK